MCVLFSFLGKYVCQVLQKIELVNYGDKWTKQDKIIFRKKIFLLRDIPCMCLCALPVGRRRNNNSHHHFDDDDRLASNNVAPKQQLSVPAD